MSYPANWPVPGKMHFRLEEPRLGRLDLDCDAGYVVQTYDLGFPAVREVAVPNSLDDGTFDVTRFYGARSITFSIVLKPHTGVDPNSSPTAAEAKLRDRLLAFLYPGVRPTLIFSEHGDDRVKQVMVRGAQGSIAVDRKNYNKLNVSWVAPRGALLSWDPRCYEFIFSSATDDTLTKFITNDGSAPAHWQATLSGEAIKPRFILNGVGVLQLDYTSNPGDIIVIDSFSRTVSINGEPSGYKYVDDNASWSQIPPGVSELRVEQDTYTIAGYPFAYWQPTNTAARVGSARVGKAHVGRTTSIVIDPLKSPTNWAIPPGTTPPNNPPPAGKPPWGWTARTDPVTGEPGHLTVDFCYYDTFV